MTTYSDQELVAMIQEGGEKGEKAMFFMYESYFNLCHVFSKKFKLNHEEVLLAYSDAMMALRNQLLKEKYKGKGRIKKYFRRILNNKCVDIIRKRTTKDKKGKVVNLESHDLPSERLNQEEALIEEENRQVREIEKAMQEELLLKAMEQLSEKCRNILMDYLVDDLTPKQINEKYIDIKNANVARSTIYSCRKKLISAIEALQSRS
jgi:RNA polymerase sigma factor (sigma-70 family)